MTEVLPTLRGTDAWFVLVNNARIITEIPHLINAALASDNPDFRAEAVRTVGKIGGSQGFIERFDQAPAEERGRLVELAAKVREGKIENWLSELRKDDTQPLAIRRAATRSYADY